MPTVVRSHAKVNLGLFLGAPRPDGFHALATVYQTLEMHDLVTVTARLAEANSLQISSNDPRVPTNSSNTVWKMISLALEQLGVCADIEVHIDKRLPVQGGLGAGSGNAVAALIGLEKELGASALQDLFTRRLGLAAKVGSDVPLFLVGGTVLGVDRGQEVYPLNDIEPTWCVVAVPEIGVSTPQAFRDWDELCVQEGLTHEASQAKLSELSRAYASAFAGGYERGTGSSGVLPVGENLAGPQVSALVRTGISSWIQNDFERVVFPQHPSLAEIKRILAAPGAPEAARPYSSLVASLSGSGSALYGLYLTRGDAEAARERLLAGGIASHLTRTLPRQAYWAQMLQDFEH